MAHTGEQVEAVPSQGHRRLSRAGTPRGGRRTLRERAARLGHEEAQKRRLPCHPMGEVRPSYLHSPDWRIHAATVMRCWLLIFLHFSVSSARVGAR